MSQIKTNFIGGLTTSIVLLFFQSAHADLGSAIKIKKMFVTQSTGMDAIGTGSSGKYVHGKHKSEGSKSKTYPKKGHGYSPHKKSEGSGSKAYAHGGKNMATKVVMENLMATKKHQPMEGMEGMVRALLNTLCIINTNWV